MTFLEPTKYNYAVQEDLLDEFDKLSLVIDNTLDGKHVYLENNSILQDVTKKIILTTKIVNTFLNNVLSVVPESKPMSISFRLDGRLHTIALGLYGGDFIYNLND